MVGVQGDMQICWTPDLPVVYITNQKSGCSTIKQSLKKAQATAFERSGMAFNPFDPHVADDCLRREGLTPAACRERYVISCVRNPFTRALSGYLDKVNRRGAMQFPELKGQKVDSFEDYLTILTRYAPAYMNPHFRPQHINLDHPRIKYDAIFFLENLGALSRYLVRIYPDFELATHAPHSRRAADKLHKHYTDKAVDLVRSFFAQDFALFGYSDDIETAGKAPGEMIVADALQIVEADPSEDLSPPHHATPGLGFEATLRYRRLVDMGLL